MAIVGSRPRFFFSGFFMVEEASGILTLNRKRQIGYMHGPRSEVDRLISVRQSVTLNRTKGKRERTAPSVSTSPYLRDACALSNHSSGLDRVLRLLDLGCAQSEARPKAGIAARASASRRVHGLRVRSALFGRSAFRRSESPFSSRPGMDCNAGSSSGGWGGGFCNLGATAHWKKLERPGNYPQGTRTHSQRPLRANPPSDLHRTSCGLSGHSDRNRRVSRDCGLSSNCGRLRSKSETRRGFSRDAVRAGI